MYILFLQGKQQYCDEELQRPFEIKKSFILIKYELARNPKTDHIGMGSMFLNNNINKERPFG